MALILLAITLKMNKGVRFLKKLWCSVSGVVKYKDCFYQRFIEKIGDRGELGSWQFRALALASSERIRGLWPVRCLQLEVWSITMLFFPLHANFHVRLFIVCQLVVENLAELNQICNFSPQFSHHLLFFNSDAPQCQDYTVLSEPNRQQSLGYGSNSDNRLVPCWYRFQSSSYSNAALI